MKYLTLIVFIIFGLGACSSGYKLDNPKPDPVISSKMTEWNIVHPPLPSKVQMLEVVWSVYNKEELLAMIKEAEKTNKEIVMFSISEKGYENLALNVQELKRYILEQQEVIKYYRNSDPQKDSSVANTVEK